MGVGVGVGVGVCGCVCGCGCVWVCVPNAYSVHTYVTRFREDCTSIYIISACSYNKVQWG